MYTKVEHFTPARAVEILDTKNFNNRPISQFTVDRYAQEMKAGRWKLNGEAIIFGKSGRLLDGQHRLKACIQANVDFESVMVLGAEDSAFDTIDDGKVRGMHDVLSIRGEKNTASLAAGLRFVWDYATGDFFGTPTAAGVLSSKQLLERLLEKHPGIRKSASLYAVLNNRNGGMMLPPSLMIGLHYLFSLLNEDKADDFFTSLQSGLGLTEDNPVFTLRNRLISLIRDRQNKKATRELLYAYTVYAWNAFVQDKQLRGFSVKLKEELPQIEGLSRETAAALLE